MSILFRAIFREIFAGALLGTVLFTFVLFLQRISKLFELLVRSSAPPQTVATLFLYVLPPILTHAIPIGVLVGVLIALSRLSGDGEVTAMRSAGISGRRLLPPVLTFALIGTLIAGVCSTWLTPLALTQSVRILNKLVAEQLTAEVVPRVFEEGFTNMVLYVGDVVPGPVVRWRNVFMADLAEPGKRQNSSHDAGEGPRITVAAEAIAVPDVARNRIQLQLRGGSAHEVGKVAEEYNNTTFPLSNQILEAPPPREEQARPYTSLDMGPLWKRRAESVEARIEFHRRLALPIACLLLALLGVPLGIASRKGGKSSAFVLTVLLALGYYTGLISLIGLAQEGTLPAWVAVWTPDAILLVVGLFFAVRLEKPGDRDLLASGTGAIASVVERISGVLRWKRKPTWRWYTPVLAKVIDVHVLSSFLFYFVLFLSSFVLLTEVFNFFELLGDMVKNRITLSKMLTYHLYLAPKLVYDATPASVLVAVLVTFGVMTKQNEVTAFKACGVSMHRLAWPVLAMASLLSGLLFAFDHYYLPEANRKQDALRSEIKGLPVQTHLNPNRKWIFGERTGGSARIYFYKYLDTAEGVMLGANVYDLEPATFRLRRHIMAERARWEPSLKAWVFQDGWTRKIDGVNIKEYTAFQGGTASYPELNEPPSWFIKEVRQDKQMNFQQLAAYIEELRQSGFNTVRLQVQYHKKFAVPLFALIMAMVSIPFAFLTGNRGAMAGVGVSFGVAITYWITSSLFEQIGYVNQLPAAMAAWSPALLFSLAGLYLLTRMRT